MALFEPVFEALNRADARYIVVGGVAVVLHGHPRLTADLDLVIDLEHSEALKAIRALTALGLRPRVAVDPDEFADREVRARWRAEKGMEVFSLYDPDDPLRAVDLFTENPVAFEDLWRRAEVIDVEGRSVRVASIPDLIAMKRISGRPQDDTDIQALEEILRRRRDG